MATLRDLGIDQDMPNFEPGTPIGPQGQPLSPADQSMIDQIMRSRPPSAMQPAPMPQAPNTQQDLLRRLQPQQGVPMSGMQPPVTLASMGQKYRNMPAATFDQRFGPYNTGPRSDQDILRMFIEQQQRRDPNVIRPGTPSWPFGYTQT